MIEDLNALEKIYTDEFFNDSKISKITMECALDKLRNTVDERTIQHNIVNYVKSICDICTITTEYYNFNLIIQFTPRWFRNFTMCKALHIQRKILNKFPYVLCTIGGGGEHNYYMKIEVNEDEWLRIHTKQYSVIMHEIENAKRKRKEIKHNFSELIVKWKKHCLLTGRIIPLGSLPG